MSGSDRGAILVVALVTLALLSVLGGAVLRVASGEREQARQAERETLAFHLADAGIERVLAWFAEPSNYPGPRGATLAGPCPAPATAEEDFRKRCAGRNGVQSFRTADGRAQFIGRLDLPDVSYAWRSPLDAWSDPPTDRAMPVNNVDVRLWAPISPDAIATVLSRATVGPEVVTIRAELIQGPWSGLVGAVYAGEAGTGPFPVRVHWGHVFVDGPIDLSPVWDRLPRNDPSTAISAAPYSAEPGIDRWFNLTASGAIQAPILPVGNRFGDPYGHIHPNATVPRLGVWAYDALKRYAKRHGRYFTTRGTGLLYADGQDPGLTPSAVFGTVSGSRREVLFVDTLDQQAPRSDNLERLRLELNGAAIDAYLGAHVVMSAGAGRSVTVDVLPEGIPLPAVGGLILSQIHYVGALLVAGEVETENRVNIFGAIAAGQGFRDRGGLEIWYDAGLRSGDRPGFAPVVVKPGSRRIIAPDSP